MKRGVTLRAAWMLYVLASLAHVQEATAEEAAAPADAAAQANNPLADMKALNFQNMYTGKVSGLDKNADQFMLRYAQPVEIYGTKWLMRATIPLNTVPSLGDGYVTGLGDVNVFAAYLFDTGNPAVSFGFGPQITVPSATSSDTGDDSWSLGFANVLFNASSRKVQWGYLLIWQASVDSNPENEFNSAAFQPFLFYQIEDGWYLRSSGIWNYDFLNNSYATPIGFGVGKVIKIEKAVMNAFVEPQYAALREGDGQPEWNVFAGINFQF